MHEHEHRGHREAEHDQDFARYGSVIEYQLYALWRARRQTLHRESQRLEGRDAGQRPASPVSSPLEHQCDEHERDAHEQGEPGIEVTAPREPDEAIDDGD